MRQYPRHHGAPPKLVSAVVLVFALRLGSTPHIEIQANYAPMGRSILQVSGGDQVENVSAHVSTFSWVTGSETIKLKLMLLLCYCPQAISGARKRAWTLTF